MSAAGGRSVTIPMVVALALGACGTPNKQYQTNPSTVVISGSGYSEGKTRYRLRAIEFDEQGIHFDSKQEKSALAAIRALKRPLVIVFIHGWHHNASSTDTDLRSFDRLLARLAENKATVGASLIGIFIGWRGLTIPREWDWTGVGWVARHASFYSRKHTTARLAGVDLTKALYDISRTARDNDGYIIFVGHSFGGRILEHAVAQGLIGQNAAATAGNVNKPADLTLLLNPASEALSARQLKLALRKWDAPTPPIISLTSENDSATKVAWPIATNVTSVFSRGYRPLEKGVSERRYVTSTAGHFPIVIDRRVRLAEIAPSEAPSDAVAWNVRHATIQSIRAANAWWEIHEIVKTEDTRTPLLINKKRARGYWVVQVPKEIINGHGGIFDDGSIEFIAGLFKICRREIISRESITLAPTELTP